MQGSQTQMGSGAAYGQFKSWRAALEQRQELEGRKRAFLRVVYTLKCTIL
jgi:hypothetical protein